MSRSTKGAYDLGRKAVYMVVVLLIISVLFVYVTNTVADFQGSKIKALGLIEKQLTADRLLSCFAFEQNERVHLGIMDKSKLNGNTLNKCFKDASLSIKVDEIYVTLGSGIVQFYKPVLIFDKNTESYSNAHMVVNI
jgi:hypothetical protein